MLANSYYHLTIACNVQDSMLLIGDSFRDIVDRATNKIVTKQMLSTIRRLPQYITTADTDDYMVGVNELNSKYIALVDKFDEFAVVFKSLVR